jgi:hypothetical protein
MLSRATFAWCSAPRIPLAAAASRCQTAPSPSLEAGTGSQSRVTDLAATVDRLQKEGVHFRNAIVTGVGGRQILVNDPSGSPVELFEPTIKEARLNSPSC